MSSATADPAPTVSARSVVETQIRFDRVDFCYGTKKVLHEVTLDIPKQKVTAFIGPSGCGKSTVLRCVNRMNDLVPGARITSGLLTVDGIDINLPTQDITELRRRVGMVFQKSNPFADSIYQNVSYGLRVAGVFQNGTSVLCQCQPDRGGRDAMSLTS